MSDYSGLPASDRPRRVGWWATAGLAFGLTLAVLACVVAILFLLAYESLDGAFHL